MLWISKENNRKQTRENECTSVENKTSSITQCYHTGRSYFRENKKTINLKKKIGCSIAFKHAKNFVFCFVLNKKKLFQASV
jgi:hypothetical protein